MFHEAKAKELACTGTWMCFFLLDDEAAGEQSRGADKHSACADVRPVITRAAHDPIMFAAIR